MDAPTTAVDAVKLAKAAADKRIALVGTAAKRAEKIATMNAKLLEEHDLYHKEYQDALTAWSKDDLAGFGLVSPEQLPTGSTKRASAKRA